MQPETRFRATFKRMDESTAEEWALIEAQDDGIVGALPDRILDLLRLLDSGAGGFAVDRLTHSLQTAHRAEEDGRDDAYIVCALVHDIGDTLTPLNHADLGAAIVNLGCPSLTTGWSSTTTSSRVTTSGITSVWTATRGTYSRAMSSMKRAKSSWTSTTCSHSIPTTRRLR